MTRLDRVATVQARIGWKALTAAEYVDDGHIFLSTPNIKNRDIDFENVNYISSFRYEESPELKLQIGDVLLAKDGSTLGIANYVRHLPGPTTVNGSIAVVRPHDVEPSFLTYWLQGQVIQSRIQELKDGMGVPHLFQQDIRKLPVPDLERQEQRRIADFLDDRVSRIDRIIAARRLQASLIQSIRLAEMSERMDELAAAFGLAPLRRFCAGIEQGASPVTEDRPADSGECGVLKTSAIQGGTFRPDQNKVMDPDRADDRFLVCWGDVLVTRGSGSADLVGDAAVAQPKEGQRLYLSDLTYRLRSLSLVPDYACLAIICARGRAELGAMVRQGSGPAKARGEDVLSISVPRAPIGIQRVMVDDWEKIERIAAVGRSRVEASADLLGEFKESLITAAVTGELDVTTAGSGIPG